MNIIFKSMAVCLFAISVPAVAASSSSSSSLRKSLSGVTISYTYPGDRTRTLRKPLVNLPHTCNSANEKAVAVRIASVDGSEVLPEVSLTEVFIQFASGKNGCVFWSPVSSSGLEKLGICPELKTFNTIDDIKASDLESI